jgi:hypothetical protein
MLTFEMVLKCFDLLIQKEICEVLLTRYGYVVMEWDAEEHEWYNVIHCNTPAELRDAIIAAYEGYLSLELIADSREQTAEQAHTIQKRSAALRLLCDTHGIVENI